MKLLGWWNLILVWPLVLVTEFVAVVEKERKFPFLVALISAFRFIILFDNLRWDLTRTLLIEPVHLFKIWDPPPFTKSIIVVLVIFRRTLPWLVQPHIFSASSCFQFSLLNFSMISSSIERRDRVLCFIGPVPKLTDVWCWEYPFNHWFIS